MLFPCLDLIADKIPQENQRPLKMITKEVFEMKRTTLVYYLQNEPKCDQL